MNAPNFSKPEHDTTVKINWLSFNVPTLLALASALWFYASDRGEIKGDIEELRLTIQANQSSMQLQFEGLRSATQAWQTAMDKTREAARADYDKKLSPLLENNIPFRVTSLEVAVDKNKQSSDERVDRVSAAVGQLRDNTAETNTKLALQDQKINQILDTLAKVFPNAAPLRRQ